MKRPLAYITAAWSGEHEKDGQRAAGYCRAVYEAGFSPLCPVLYCSGARLMSKMTHNSCQNIFMHINRKSPGNFPGLLACVTFNCFLLPRHHMHHLMQDLPLTH